MNRIMRLILCAVVLFGLLPAKEKVIFDTDMGGDIDDAGALAMLHNLADAGEIEFLAVVAVNGNEKTVPFIDAVNTFFGRPDLPIGTVKGAGPYLDRNKYLDYVTANYPHDMTKDDAPEAVSLYRQILSSQPDGSVTIVVVGQCTNISNLLDSPADQYSSLNGVELMRKKVKFYGAGGNGDANLPSGRCGHNYRTDLTSANNELAKLPTEFPTVFAGGSGKYISVGDELKNLPSDDIIYQAYYDYFDGGDLDRPTWDQCRVLFAARPSVRSLFDVSAAGNITLSGETITWTGSPDRNRAYAYAKSNTQIQSILSELMLRRSSSPTGDAVDLISAATFADQSTGWSTDDGRTVDRAHDASTSTEAWGIVDEPLWLEYRFDKEYDLESARVYDDNAGAHEIGTWKVMYHDGSGWQDACAWKSSDVEGWSTVSVEGITTDRVRVVCQGPEGVLMELREFECTGTPADTQTTGIRPLEAVPVAGQGFRIDTGGIDPGYPGFSLRIFDGTGVCITDLSSAVSLAGQTYWDTRTVVPGVYLASLREREEWVGILVVTE